MDERRRVGGGVLSTGVLDFRVKMQCSTTPSLHYSSPYRLGDGIGSTGKAKKKPDDQEQNAGKLRKRRRDMEESAT